MEATVSALLDWFKTARRVMPWREQASPWRTLVSELMLQQTRVAVVVPRFEAFLARFPDPAAMALATEDEVLAQWSGLGYYRRARSLHAAAREIVDRHGGAVPDDRKALLALPGIGAYTAGAVLSIAFGQAEPVVDGNVERVFARRFGITGNVKKGEARKQIHEFARAAASSGPPGDVNQALMELGALICTPTGPKCSDCPVAPECVAHAEGTEESLPTLPERKTAIPITLAVGLAEIDGRILLVRHPEGGFLSGTWGPPFAPVTTDEDGESLIASTARDHGVTITVGELLGTIKHQITHHRITGRCHRALIEGDVPKQGVQLLLPEELHTIGLSSLAKKALRYVLPTQTTTPRPLP